jgi:uncharacterized protein YvpB
MNEYLKQLSKTDPAMVMRLCTLAGVAFLGFKTATTTTVTVEPKTMPTIVSTLKPEIKIAEKTTDISLTPKQEEIIHSAISPALSQRDNYTMPFRTCNSSSNAMFLNFYRPLLQKPKVTDDEYLASVLKRGDTIYHEVQTTTLKVYGLDTVWDDSGNEERLKKITSQGLPVVINILHRGSVLKGTLYGGHIIVVTNYDPIKKSFTVHDPYGLLESDYKDYSKLVYQEPENLLMARWQGGARYLSKTQTQKFNLMSQ